MTVLLDIIEAIITFMLITLIVVINIFTIYILITAKYKLLKYLLLFFILIVLCAKYLSYDRTKAPYKRASIEFIGTGDFVIDNTEGFKIITFSSDIEFDELYEASLYGSTSISRLDDITNDSFIIETYDIRLVEKQDDKYIYRAWLDCETLPNTILTDVVCRVEFNCAMKPNTSTHEMVIPYQYLEKIQDN